MNPLVSIVIPAYNAENYLGFALQSVFAQEYRNWELIVSLDAPTDNTAEIARDWRQRFSDRIQVLESATNRGSSVTRNEAITRARGEWIALLDADDLWQPSKLRLQMELAAEGHKSISTLVEQFWSEEIPDEQRYRLAAAEPHAEGSSAALIHRSVFETVGLFDEGARNAEWIEWALRASDAGFKSAVVPQPLTLRRVHLSNKSRESTDSRLRFLKASLERRRKKVS